MIGGGWIRLWRDRRDVRLLEDAAANRIRLDQLPAHLQDDVRVSIARRRLAAQPPTAPPGDTDGA